MADQLRQVLNASTYKNPLFESRACEALRMRGYLDPGLVTVVRDPGFPERPGDLLVYRVTTPAGDDGTVLVWVGASRVDVFSQYPGQPGVAGGVVHQLRITLERREDVLEAAAQEFRGPGGRAVRVRLKGRVMAYRRIRLLLEELVGAPRSTFDSFDLEKELADDA